MTLTLLDQYDESTTVSEEGEVNSKNPPDLSAYQLALSDCLQFNYLMDFLPDKSRQLSRLAPCESVARNLAESGG